MFLSTYTYELEHGRHVARLHHRRRRRRRRRRRGFPFVPLYGYGARRRHGFPFVPLYGYGAPLGGLRPPELR